MLSYYLLDDMIDEVDRPRVVGNLKRLRAFLDSALQPKDCEQTLLLGTWNIRDFAKSGGGRGYGRREPESLFYIAEIISRYDFIALQEINELPQFEQLMRLLGPHWRFIATDVTHASLGGNGERLTYCWDNRKVTFQNIAGEIVLPADALVSRVIVEPSEEADKPVYAGKQFRRSPFFARFQSGWFKYDICTAHIYYGKESGRALQERIEEIDRIAAYLAQVAKDAKRKGRATILLGDFNIVHPEHKTMEALTRHGFRVPATLAEPTNFVGDKYYDQIAFLASADLIRALEETDTDGSRNAGILDIFSILYTREQLAEYEPQMRKNRSAADKTGAKLEAYYRQWLTWQLSDHRPLWVRLPVDQSGPYLDRMARV